MVIAEEVRGGVGASTVGSNAPPDTVNLVPDAGAPPAPCPRALTQRQGLDGCWPTRHLGNWMGFWLGDPEYYAADGSRVKFPLGAVRLRIDDAGAATLTFGSEAAPAPPLSPDDPYLCAGTSPATGCPAATRLVEGFAYSLEAVELIDAGVESAAPRAGELPLRRGEGLTFAVPLEQPWRSWCGLQVPQRQACPCEGCNPESPPCERFGLAIASGELEACSSPQATSASATTCGWLSALAAAPCSCDAEGCTAVAEPLRFELSMSESGQALRGAYLPARAGLPMARIDFSREAR